METANDSIKYVMPVYTNAQRDAFDWDLEQPAYTMEDRYDSTYDGVTPMYESSESRYVTELVNVEPTQEGLEVTVPFKGGAFGEEGENYIPGDSVVYIVEKNGKRHALAVQAGEAYTGKDHKLAEWFSKTSVTLSDNTKVTVSEVEVISGVEVKVKLEASNPYDSSITDLPEGVTFKAVGRYDSEKDLTGKHLGEVELVMKDYHFRPRPVTLGVTWTQMTELVLDTSFGISAEETLLDAASQEIKKSLDYQAVKFAYGVQKAAAGDNFVQFNAEASTTHDVKDSYFHTAQLIGQSITRIGDIMLNKINRGGVSAIVGGPAAVSYLTLNKGWSDKGKQPAIGGHKFGELDGIPVFKVPSNIIPDDTLITTWKNPAAESDVSIAIGTLLPFYSTGKLVRKNFYSEEGIARYEDTQCLNPLYLGRIQVNNIREVSTPNMF